MIRGLSLALVSLCVALAGIVALSILPVFENRSRGAYISDLFVKPSTRKKELGLEIEITGRIPAGTAEVTARLLDETGRQEKQFISRVNCTAADKQVLTLAFPWPDPRLWDLGKPNLYTVVLSVNAGDFDAEIRQNFGFREFWVQGKRFYLNGIPIRLRPDTGQDIADERAAGFNLTEVGSAFAANGSTADSDPKWFDKADRVGWLAAAPLASMVPYIVDKRQRVIWNDARREEWTQRVEGEIRRLRNHPSIVMWAHSPGFFGSPQDQNPRVIGKAVFFQDRQKQAGLEGCAIIRRLDPTRPVHTPRGGDVGDIFTVSHNLNLIPLQEQEEWMTEWAKSGDMPVMGVGGGTPFYVSFLRGRMDYSRAITTEPLVTEFAAIYTGRQAYADETAEYRNNYTGRFEQAETYRFDPGTDSAAILHLPAFQTVEALFTRNTLRSWRTTGITGGREPWEPRDWNGVALNKLDKARIENDGPTLVWITGPYDAPTAKTHSYHVDETVEKQVAIINDTRQVHSYRYAWTAFINGKSLSSGHGQGRIWPAQTLFRPLRFATPFFSSGKADGQILLKATIGDQAHEDRFAYRVFARRARREHPPVLPVFDPSGRTGDILPVADYVPRTWKGERNIPLVIVGQNALAAGRGIPDGLESYVRSGGRLLVCAQHREWMEKTLGLRTAAYLARRVFPVSENHPLMRGLDALDLRDWRGGSSVLPAKPTYTGNVPLTGWHWGNRGVVSSISIEKPHMSSWRPLLEDEFDLAYTPLMEMEYGRGRIIWCTLDLEDHAVTDAAAERVFYRILDYALHAPLAPKAERVVYVGDRSGIDLLDRLGVIYRSAGMDKRTARALTGLKTAPLLIVGPGAGVNAADLAHYLHAGGRALFLARSETMQDFGPELNTAARHGSLAIPNWSECRGLSVSDMHWRADVEVPVIRSLPDLEDGGVHTVSSIGADGLLARMKLGKGVALFCQIAPDQLNADQKTYLRYTRWRQTRTLCQLLSNLGASFRQDARLFHPTSTDSAAPGFYHPDYRTDFELGDDPYRFYPR